MEKQAEENIIGTEIIYIDGIKYHSETKIVPFGKGTILVTNNTPILTPKERERRKQEINDRLYAVFSKYVKSENT